MGGRVGVGGWMWGRGAGERNARGGRGREERGVEAAWGFWRGVGVKGRLKNGARRAEGGPGRRRTLWKDKSEERKEMTSRLPGPQNWLLANPGPGIRPNHVGLKREISPFFGANPP